MIGYTLPEIRRLLVNLIQGYSPDPVRVWAWSRWRRRHQYQARLCHYRRRGYALTQVPVGRKTARQGHETGYGPSTRAAFSQVSRSARDRCRCRFKRHSAEVTATSTTRDALAISASTALAASSAAM
jgi:hypothetical protein